MKKKELHQLANLAGYALGMVIVPEKCYTLTDLQTRKKYRMKVGLRSIVKILCREVERKTKT